MKFKEYIVELSQELGSGVLPEPFSQIDSRDNNEVTSVLKSLCRFAGTYYEELKEFESLESLFRKHYLAGKQDFLTPGEFFNIASKKQRVFDNKENTYFIVDEVVNNDALDAIYEGFVGWIGQMKEQHSSTQNFIKNTMIANSNREFVTCHCNICVGDFRAKLRDLAYLEMEAFVDKELTGLEDRVIDQSIDKNALIYTGIKKQVDQSLYKLRRRLKPGTLRRLEKQIKAYVLEKMGPKSSLARIYGEKLRLKINSMLVERQMKPDLAEEEEVTRFLEQMGLGIWKFESAIEKELTRFITAVMTYKRKDISSTILNEYLGEFWVHSKARKMKRKIIYHMGPTNSGKTYHAVQALSKAKTGCYLAPLRLLAGELYDTLNTLGAVTSLLTGEEVVDTEGATHYSSTIEMAKLNDEFECCVIDEIQMIADPQRGWAWTRALVGICSPEIHVCGDPSVLELVRKILELTNDELEVIEYDRMTELIVEKKQIRLTDLKKNDALIVFSRKNALKYKADLESLGFSVSIVYGRLSPEVRREQARKFDSGETDIIVSTDAIAMGMNLPVQRIVFSTLSKFYNAKEHFLSHSEIKQIAGRAGRFKLFPTGYVNCLVKVDQGIDRLKDALTADLEQAETAMVGPDLDIFNLVNDALFRNKLLTLSLTEFIMLFNTMIFRKPFYCVDLKEMIEVAEMVEDANEGLNAMSDAEIFGFACAPVNLGQMEHVQYFSWMVNNFAHQVPITNELIDSDSASIDYLETGIKCVELYQWLSRHFEGRFFQFDEVKLLENKRKAVDQLNVLLSEKIVRSCSSCGAGLPDKHDYNICETCFSSRRFRPRNNRSASEKDDKGGDRRAKNTRRPTKRGGSGKKLGSKSGAGSSFSFGKKKKTNTRNKKSNKNNRR